jgi:hypothetical protein
MVAEMLGQDADAVALLLDGDLVSLFDSADSMKTFFSSVCETSQVNGTFKQAYAPLLYLADNVTTAEVEEADIAKVCRPRSGELETAYGCVPPMGDSHSYLWMLCR